MNEIQVMEKTELEAVKKNSKKGFTLVELVVVIAILAIIAAIAIPVVSTIIDSSNKSKAESNAQTIELAIKEASAQIASNDQSNGYTSSTTVADVASKKAITDAFDSVNYKGVSYSPVWVASEEKVYFVDSSKKVLSDDASSTTTIEGTELTATAPEGGSSPTVNTLINPKKTDKE